MGSKYRLNATIIRKLYIILRNVLSPTQASLHALQSHNTRFCLQPDNPKTSPKINKIDSDSDSKISKSISVNDNETVAFVDLGSTRTLIRKSFAENVVVLQRCAVTLNWFGGGKFLCPQKLLVKIEIDDSD